MRALESVLARTFFGEKMKSIQIALGFVLAAAFSSTAQAQTASEPATTNCFELSANGTAWSRTPERLCIENAPGSPLYILRFQSGMPANDVFVARLNLLERARCIDCNQDRFGLANPSNSVLNALTVVFDGHRTGVNGAETGTVRVGTTTFHYRRSATIVPPRTSVPRTVPMSAPATS